MFFDQDSVASLEQSLKRCLVQVNLERINNDKSGYVTLTVLIWPKLTYIYVKSSNVFRLGLGR